MDKSGMAIFHQPVNQCELFTFKCSLVLQESKIIPITDLNLENRKTEMFVFSHR